MSFLFHLLGIESVAFGVFLNYYYYLFYLNFSSPFSLLNWKQIFILELFSLPHASPAYNWSKNQTFRLSCNHFTGKSFIDFHSDLAESRRIESSEALMKANLCSPGSFHACPCSDFHPDYCSILQWGIRVQISKGFSWVWCVWSSPYEHLYFHLFDAEVWQGQLADNMILLLADDCQNYWLPCSEYELNI